MNLLRSALALALAGAALVSLSSCGPHMAKQLSIKPYEQEMPPVPAGTVPRGGSDRLPSAEEAASLTSPLEVTPELVAQGELYYGYYCAMCHGPDGLGRTPVGEAYDPRPAVLTDGRVQELKDGQLYRAMLLGKGHEPVLQSTVPVERRWPIVAFVRALPGATTTRPRPAGPTE